MEKKQYIEAGKIVNTHGIRGEVRIMSWLDTPEALCGFRTLYPEGAAPLTVRSARVHKGTVIASFDGLDSVNDVMGLKGKTVSILREDAKLPAGHFFLSDLLGAAVSTEDGTPLGTLTEILDLPAQRVYVVRGEREHLIPAVPEFVLRSDPEAGTVTVRLIEGM